MLVVLVVLLGQYTAFSQYLSFEKGILGTTEKNTLPLRELYSESNSFFEVSYNFDGAYISTTEVNSEQYQFLSIEGFSKMQEPGFPALPALNDMIALPEDSHVTLEILNVQFNEFPGFNIHPALKPAMDTEGSPEPAFEKNEQVYNTNVFFPENPVEIIYTYKIRGIEVAVVQVRPVQYNPVTGIIRVYQKLSYRINYNSPTNSFGNISTNNSLHFSKLLRNTILNKSSLPEELTGSTMKSENGAKNYIIVTNSEFESQASELADWKRQLGYSVEIVSGTNWTSAQIKSEIKSRYDNWIPKPDYVLIFGDHDGPYAVPGVMRTDPFYGDSYATDLYYVCMDGESDWHPDMAHGRISVSNVEEAQVVVDKIINYEKTPVNNASFYENGLTCANYQDDNNDGFADRRFCHTSEDIRDYLQNEQGYVADRVYYSTTSANLSSLRYNNGFYSSGQLLPADLRTGVFNWSGGSADITSSLNAGKFLLIHRDHGYVGGLGWAHPYYTTSSMAGLNNGNMLPVVFSINCHTGEFQLPNCFAEKFLRMESKGAVGVVAAAYYSFSGYNDALATGMIDAIWPDPGLYSQFGSGGTGINYQTGPGNEISTMGDVVNQGLYAMEINWAGAAIYNAYQYELFHWFGDPAMKIWTENPNNNAITSTHNYEIDCNSSLFEVNNSTPGALATLVFNNALIGMSMIDESGNGLIEYSISEAGEEIVLTISKTNHKPYVASIAVSGLCSFPPDIQTQAATLISMHSAVLGGFIADDYDEAVTESGVVYSTLPNPEIGGAGVIDEQTDPLVALGLFSLNVDGLQSATKYYFKAYAINAYGLSYGEQLSFNTLEAGTSIPYAQTFENGGSWPEGWSTNNSSVWSMSTTWRGTSPPGGYNIYSDYNPAETGTVFTPIFNGSDKMNLHVKFYHYWKANYSSATQDGYFYGSIDGGLTYPYLIDEWHHNNPGLEEGDQEYDISSWADGYENISFKWVVSHNNDWYWQFDNFEIFEISLPGTWVGSGSSDWNDPANWHGGVLPESATDVVIGSVKSGGFLPELNSGGGAVCNDLTIESGAHLYVPSGKWLTVNGTITNNAGLDGLVLKSEDTGAAGSLINTTPNVLASVERYLSQMQWHFIGIPVKDAQAGIFYLPGQSDIYLNTYDQPTNTWGGWIVPVTTPLTLGKGYECWVDNNVYQNEIINIDGLLNTGDLTTGTNGFLNLDYDPGFGLNFISNPYPSAIEVDIDTWDKKNVSNTVWTWDQDEGNYLYWNSTNSNNSNGYGTLPNGIIQAMQGFFVLATGDSPKLTFPQRSRVHSNSVFYKNTDDIMNTLKLDVVGNGYSDAIFVSFNPEATDNYESDFDVNKFYGLPEAPQLYSVVNTSLLSMNTLAPLNFQKSIQLGFECANGEIFTFKASAIESFEGNLPIFLEDKLENVIVSLRDNPEYSFTHAPENQSLRFVLHFGDPNGYYENLENTAVIYAFDDCVYSKMNTNTDYALTIYDMMGREILQKNCRGNILNKLKVTSESGFCTVRVISTEGSLVKKVYIK